MSPADITWTEIATAAVALYGAGLSTYVMVRDWKARRPDIKAEVSEGAVELATGGWSGHMIFIEAFNRGHKAATLKMVGFVLPNGARFIIPYPSPYVAFPYDLLPEKSCRVFTPAADLAAHLKGEGFPEKVSLIGYYDDEVGRRYESKPTIFDRNTAKLVQSAGSVMD